MTNSDPNVPLVRVSQLDHVFGQYPADVQVLFGIDLELMPGQMTVLTGPSGSGKTTLLTLIGCLRKVQSGSVELLGCELRGASPKQQLQLRRRLGFIFQTHNLIESLTAQQNVEMALQLQPMRGAAKQQRSEEILCHLGLEDYLSSKPRQMSVGQRQRVAMARALATRPKVVLADEPTASLDRASAQQALRLLKETCQQNHACLLMVTHDARVIDEADKIVRLVDGRIPTD